MTSARPGLPVDHGSPDQLGEPQRAADVEAQLLRGGAHAPDTIVDHGILGGLVVRAASIRGAYGRWGATAREDDYAIGAAGDGRWLLLAVADGVTAASDAHVAAALAARTAVQQAGRLLDQLAAEGGGPADLDARGIFQSAAYQLRRAYEGRADRAGPADRAGTGDRTAPSGPADDEIAACYATTLLLAVLPTRPDDGAAHLAAVGDTSAWLVGDDGWAPVLAARAPEGELASAAVSALPRLPDQLDVATVALPPGRTLLLATDGVTDALGGDAGSPVAAHLAACWRPPLPSPLEFARQVSFRGRSWDDDRTAIAVTWADGTS